MELLNLLNSLGYSDSPNFLRGESLGRDRDFGHIFRKAQDECRLQGVYLLNASSFDQSQSNVPVVYVCEADSEAEAREIHKKVWNQNAVPFLIIVSPLAIRLYPGFSYQRDTSGDPLNGALGVFEKFNEALHAKSINSGRVWNELGSAVTPDKRVDWQLLENLRKLDNWLREDGGVHDRKLAHAMIGKFVYIHYLRQRNILSDSRLGKWEINQDHIFSHDARLNSFIELVDHLDEWLNGAVFPLSSTKIREFGAGNLRKVASVFMGEQAQSGQLPLFDIYDFSFIPIETLSVIYEQFLHESLSPSGESEGKARGAYYTPVPLVNFMLDKLDARKPLERGMRVLDPSCGSGAFLVQCYRKLIERRRREVGRRLRPAELGKLLTDHIFGVDINGDACQIAELSLALTLLEYINPPDLTETSFKLPALRGVNIFNENAFDDKTCWYKEGRPRPFQWIVGNPPWKELNPKKLDPVDEVAWQWMQGVRKEHPVGGNQLAEAFVWRASEVLAPDGAVVLLLPAMTLFKYESTAFRKVFLKKNQLWSVANFANLRHVLFGGRAILPAAAFFYSQRLEKVEHETSDSSIEVFSPMIANLPESCGKKSRGRRKTWNIVVNASDLREIDYRYVINGDSLSWKIGMWGSEIDRRVLAAVKKRFSTIETLEDDEVLFISEGLQLRSLAQLEIRSLEQSETERTEQHGELAEKLTVNVSLLKNRKFLRRFPTDALMHIKQDETIVRMRGGFDGPMRVNEPPHVIVGASRNFAIYTEEFLVVPARQIGIVSPKGDKSLLKAIALFLNSDFVTYHQFLTSTEDGIQIPRNTLKALRSLPLPFHGDGDLHDWETLYSQISTQCAGREDFNRPELVKTLNELTADSLKLSARARAAVHDLVHVRLDLNKGKTGASAVGQPKPEELKNYAKMLRDELDSFVARSSGSRHKVDILIGDGSGLVCVEIVHTHTTTQPIRIVEASDRDARQLAKTRSLLSEQHGQWLYFNRNIRVYDGPRTYLLKPLQHLHWTQTQAIQDASEIIADSLQPDPAVSVGESQ
ncbi:MAG: N-6 DNA methylase [Terracidiphilus sp.]|jgi:methylase of polypeptide subunit release factors